MPLINTIPNPININIGDIYDNEKEELKEGWEKYITYHYFGNIDLCIADGQYITDLAEGADKVQIIQELKQNLLVACKEYIESCKAKEELESQALTNPQNIAQYVIPAEESSGSYADPMMNIQEAIDAGLTDEQLGCFVRQFMDEQKKQQEETEQSLRDNGLI